MSRIKPFVVKQSRYNEQAMNLATGYYFEMPAEIKPENQLQKAAIAYMLDKKMFTVEQILELQKNPMFDENILINFETDILYGYYTLSVGNFCIIRHPDEFAPIEAPICCIKPAEIVKE